MPSHRALFPCLPLVFAFATTAPIFAAPTTSKPAPPAGMMGNKTGITTPDAKWSQPLTGAPAALHVLNRLAFGPQPGQVEEVQAMGVRRWIESQLHPAAIDDSVLEAKLAGFQLIQSDPAKLSLMYRGDNGAIQRYLQMQMPGNRKKKRLETVAAQNADNANGPADPNAKPSRLERTLNDRQQQTLDDFQAAGMAPGISVITAGQLVQAKVVRAVESKRQLQEVLADFWSNHFNIDMRKKSGRTLKVLDDREVIRPHLFGSFRELLGASAHSPAMLDYLDNARSSVEVKTRNGKTRGGLNENYARELMELHTLGVDGVYTQKDVTEVARCFTGWTVKPDDATFMFRPFAHDKGEKTVLGQTIPANGGQRDGERVLDMLATSPQTARFLSRKLCQRFVADDPPAVLVERVANTWMQSKGDLSSVYRALFLSPEFMSQGAYRAKIKSPFEYTVSAVRALAGQVRVPDANSPFDAQRLRQVGAISANQNAANKRRTDASNPLAVRIADLGQPIFACQPPTGWSEYSSAWVSAGAIVGRLNFALALTNGKIGDVRLSADTFRAAPVDDLAKQLVGGQLSAATRATITKETGAVPTNGARMRALILGSPEFQRR